ncbi:hypothetical protein NPX13_g211 [Xylaria arbuscula]|uniref:Uncharacterized protein n=1 Tax=Xylaria arbuscula TaxID=114810 RepID=A0A9W8NPK4_9PEZI|nr:hypothetical protein NPX13_g211 [Xylaria arbuscula]
MGQGLDSYSNSSKVSGHQPFIIGVQPTLAEALIKSLIEARECLDRYIRLEKDEEFNPVVQPMLEDKQQHFFDVRAWFAAPILTEGEDMDLKGLQSLPFIGATWNLGSGMNGTVEERKRVKRFRQLLLSYGH